MIPIFNALIAEVYTTKLLLLFLGDPIVTSTPQASKEESLPILEDDEVPDTSKEDEPVLEIQLQLAVEVLTSKSCSEEGLEDATSLLLQLSRATNATRETVLKLLLAGARQLGLTVCHHIRLVAASFTPSNSAMSQ